MKSTIKLVVGILGVFFLGSVIVYWAKMESRRESEKLQELIKPFGSNVNSTQTTNLNSRSK